jgi:transposase
MKRLGPKIINMPREDDERLLAWVAMRAKGHDAKTVAEQFGVTVQRVINATNNVMKDDLDYSKDEPTGRIRRSYWA